MIDLTKPIRVTSDGRPARVLATDLPGNNAVAIAWESPSSSWIVGGFSTVSADSCFENLPPEPRTVTVWPVWRPTGLLACALSHESATSWANLHGGRVGKPITITEECP